MDCRNFKDLLDSYISDELAVETNHEVMRHLELCPECRHEMAARRTLRQTLRSAVTATTASPDFMERLRARLQKEANTTAHPERQRDWFFARWFQNLAVPRFALAAAMCSLVLVGLVYLFFPSTPAQAAELSPTLLNQVSGDHNNCAAVWLLRTFQDGDPVHNAEKFDSALADLGKYSTHKALGLTFHYAHLCGHYGRKYLHLVYSRNNDPVSLFVSDRDAAAMKNGVVPSDDGLLYGLQKFQQEKSTVTAYQTSKHIVLTVSTLSAQENQELAEKLAKPMSLHLRKIEYTN